MSGEEVRKGLLEEDSGDEGGLIDSPAARPSIALSSLEAPSSLGGNEGDGSHDNNPRSGIEVLDPKDADNSISAYASSSPSFPYFFLVKIDGWNFSVKVK